MAFFRTPYHRRDVHRRARPQRVALSFQHRVSAGRETRDFASKTCEDMLTAVARSLLCIVFEYRSMPSAWPRQDAALRPMNQDYACGINPGRNIQENAFSNNVSRVSSKTSPHGVEGLVVESVSGDSILDPRRGCRQAENCAQTLSIVIDRLSATMPSHLKLHNHSFDHDQSKFTGLPLHLIHLRLVQWNRGDAASERVPAPCRPRRSSLSRSTCTHRPGERDTNPCTRVRAGSAMSLLAGRRRVL